MPLINQTQLIVDSHSFIINSHEHSMKQLSSQQIPVNANEVLLDFRPVEFSEKNPPRPQLPAEDIVEFAQSKGDKKLGIILSGASDYAVFAEALDDILPVLEVVVIDFNGFRDGRGYSLARELVQHPQYHQNLVLRASGDIIPDSLQLLAEVGFTQFDIQDPDFNESWFGYFNSVEHRYTGRSANQLPMFAK